MPTSRATRVTSDANDPSCSTMVLTTLPMRRNSPFNARPSISTAMACDRSPLATAPITRATSVVGWTMSSMSSLTARSLLSQPPVAPRTLARWPILPSLPTTRDSRSNSSVNCWFRLTTSLNRIAISASASGPSSGRRTVKSPRRNFRSAEIKSRRLTPNSDRGLCLFTAYLTQVGARPQLPPRWKFVTRNSVPVSQN